MKNFNDKPQRPQPPQSKQSAERLNPPQFGNKPLVVKDYNIVVFFIYNLIFAPLAVPVFLYIGDIFPYYTPLFGHIAPAGNSIGIVLSFIVIAVAFAGFLQNLRGFIIFIMSETDFERVCYCLLNYRHISPSKFQKQFVIFQ